MATLGAFEIGRVLGAGGSGTVYAARSQSTGLTEIALKVLREDTATTERERARFMEEAARMRRVSHPSLVSVLDAGFLPDGRPYVAMPLLLGESLAHRVQRGPVPLAEARVLFDDLAGAVAALHAAGLVHRDIKPENVIIGPRDGRNAATLLDLGIARDVTAPDGTTTQLGNVRGTPAYMAMERFFGTPAGVLTDIYELTVTLYVMLVGNLPWRKTEDATERMTPAHPMQLGAQMPEPLAQVLLRGLAAKPDQRFASASDLARAVAGAAGGFASEATAPTVVAPRVGFVPPPVGSDPQGFASTTLAPVYPRTSDVRAQTSPPGSSGGGALIAVGIFAGLLVLGVLVGGAIYFTKRAPDATVSVLPSVATAIPSVPSSVPSLPTSAPISTATTHASPTTPFVPTKPSASPTAKPPVDPDDLRQCEGLQGVYCSADYERYVAASQCMSFMQQLVGYRSFTPDVRAQKNKECGALAIAARSQVEAEKKKGTTPR